METKFILIYCWSMQAANALLGCMHASLKAGKAHEKLAFHLCSLFQRRRASQLIREALDTKGEPAKPSARTWSGAGMFKMDVEHC